MSTRFDEAKAALETARNLAVAPARSLFDAETARDVAVASVADTYRGDILDELDEHLNRLAHDRATFTVDDLRDRLPAHLTQGVDLKVLGSTFSRAARRKAIRPIGYTASRRRHAAPIRVGASQVVDR